MSANLSVSLAARVVRREQLGRRVETGPKHRHPEFELTWLETGHLEFDLGRSRPSLEAAAGACILLPPDFELWGSGPMRTSYSRPALEAAGSIPVASKLIHPSC